MENRCVSCGTIIPEGQQVCKRCLEEKPENSCDMPRYIANVYDNLEIVASKQGFELLGIRDKATGKVYVKERRSIDV